MNSPISSFRSPNGFVPGLSRRRLLATAAGLGAAAGAGSLLSGCSGGGGTGGSGGNGADGESASLPTLNEGSLLPADLPGSELGVEPGYFSYPSEQTQTVDTAPGSGDPMRSMVITYATPASTSKYVDAVNEALGVPLDLVLVPEPEYGQRFATVIAGGDLPETMMIPLFAQLPRIGAFLESQAVDLSEQLGGDAIQAYPNLAALPTQSWRNVRVNGRLWGVPVPRNVFNRVPFYRKDLIEERGVALPTNADEMMQFGKELTNPGRGEYAFGGFASGSISPLVYVHFSGMYDVPNQWREEGGNLTHYVETEEFKQSVDFTRRMWEAGYIHPDTPSLNSTQKLSLFNDGKIFVAEDGNAGWAGNIRGGREAAGEDYAVGVLPVFGADGGAGTHWAKPGAFSYTIITQSGAERVEEILGIANYCAAPFGSLEYTLLKFGVEGVHHELTEAGPTLTDPDDEVFTSFNYIGAAASVLYEADLIEEYVKQAHAWETETAPKLLPDPTVGLYSETASRSQSGLLTTINDEITAVVVGRKDLSALDQLAETWRTGGGDQMRQEFQEALQAE